MKWGVRRFSRGGSSASAGRPHPSDTHGTSSDAAKAQEFATRARSSGTKTLSNQELQHLVNRMNLEQQYSRLSSGPQNKGSAAASGGAKFVGNLLKQVGRQQVQNVANDAAALAINAALAKKGINLKPKKG